jgi:hypothetical protein
MGHANISLLLLRRVGACSCTVGRNDAPTLGDRLGAFCRPPVPGPASTYRSPALHSRAAVARFQKGSRSPFDVGASAVPNAASGVARRSVCGPCTCQLLGGHCGLCDVVAPPQCCRARKSASQAGSMQACHPEPWTPTAPAGNMDGIVQLGMANGLASSAARAAAACDEIHPDPVGDVAEAGANTPSAAAMQVSCMIIGAQ